MVFTGLSILLLASCLAYLVLSLFLARGLKALAFGDDSLKNLSRHKESSLIVLVAHYNDSDKIPALLNSLERQTLEIDFTLYVVDDYSDQHHLDALERELSLSNLKTCLIQNEGQPGKKMALGQAIEGFPESFIVQIDADVNLDTNFLKSLLHQKWLKSADILLGLVKMQPENNFISRFAAFEFLSLQLSGLAFAALNRPIMANGAALAYHSKTWLRFKSIGEDWASGDDSFLVQAAAQDKSLKIIAVPTAVVVTDAPKTWSSFFNQRIRWGAKSVAYPSFFAKSVAAIVAVFNLSLLTALIDALLINWSILPIVVFLLLLKVAVDYPLLSQFARRTDQQILLKSYILSALFYPFYISLSVILILLPFKRRWKGRVYR